MYVRHLMLSMLTGGISTTGNVNIHLDAVARGAALVRMESGAYLCSGVLIDVLQANCCWSCLLGRQLPWNCKEANGKEEDERSSMTVATMPAGAKLIQQSIQ